jgi:hypothetical protein
MTVETNCAKVVVFIIAAMNKGLDMIYVEHSRHKFRRTRCTLAALPKANLGAFLLAECAAVNH